MLYSSAGAGEEVECVYCTSTTTLCRSSCIEQSGNGTKKEVEESKNKTRKREMIFFPLFPETSCVTQERKGGGKTLLMVLTNETLHDA